MTNDFRQVRFRNYYVTDFNFNFSNRTESPILSWYSQVQWDNHIRLHWKSTEATVQVQNISNWSCHSFRSSQGIIRFSDKSMDRRMGGNMIRFDWFRKVKIFGLSELIDKSLLRIIKCIVDECRAQEYSLEDDIAEHIFNIKSQNDEKKMVIFSKRAKNVLDKLTDSETKRAQACFNSSARFKYQYYYVTVLLRNGTIL